MTPMELAEYSWREGHRRMADQLLTALAKACPNTIEVHQKGLIDDMKKDEDSACVAFLAFLNIMNVKSEDQS